MARPAGRAVLLVYRPVFGGAVVHRGPESRQLLGGLVSSRPARELRRYPVRRGRPRLGEPPAAAYDHETLAPPSKARRMTRWAVSTSRSTSGPCAIPKVPGLPPPGHLLGMGPGTKLWTTAFPRPTAV